jgi:hypothetical protein
MTNPIRPWSIDEPAKVAAKSKRVGRDAKRAALKGVRKRLHGWPGGWGQYGQKTVCVNQGDLDACEMREESEPA